MFIHIKKRIILLAYVLRLSNKQIENGYWIWSNDTSAQQIRNLRREAQEFKIRNVVLNDAINLLTQTNTGENK